MSKNRPDAGTLDIRFNKQFLDEVCPSEFLRLRAASTDRLREYRLLDNDLRFLDSHLSDLCLGIVSGRQGRRWSAGHLRLPTNVG